MTWATHQEALEALDEWAAEDPLYALQEGWCEVLTPYRIDACALVEPAGRAHMAARDDRRTLSQYIEKLLAETLEAQSYLQAVKQQELPGMAPASRRGV